MEPITITSAALLIGRITFEGVLSNRTDGLFCQYGNKLIKKISNNLKTPQNHDILKAVRKSYLKSTLLACRFVAKKYKVWDNFSSKAPANLREVSQYLSEQLRLLEKDKFSIHKLSSNRNIDFLIKPKDIATKERLEEIALNQKQLMLNELKNANLNWVEKDLKTAILYGWKEKKNEVDWYSLVCAFFAEELKSNVRLSTIIQTEYLIDINKKLNGFSKNIEGYINSHKKILSKINEVFSVLESIKKEIIKTVIDSNKTIIDDNEKTREAINTNTQLLRRLEFKLDGNPNNSGENSYKSIINTELFSKLSISPKTKKIGLLILKYINSQAKNLYENKVFGNEKVDFDELVWDEIFNNDDFQSQKEFVETITLDNQEVKYYTLQSIIGNHNRVWLVGEAGVGKTTTLYNIYFTLLLDKDKYPIPLLIQPQEFDSYDINIFKNTHNVVESLIIIWLQNRDILTNSLGESSNLKVYRQDRTVQKVVKTIENAIKNGEVIVLIDSFDELSRMSFQTEIFKKIFKTAANYICASRPETYLQNLHRHTSIKIRSPWALPTVKKYLQKKEELPKKWKSLIYNFVEDNNFIEWLKNPRYLNLLIDLIYHNHKNASEKFGKKEIIGFLSNGEYALFHKIFDAAFERIERYLNLYDVVSDKRKVEDLLTKVAIGQLEDGNYLLHDTDKVKDQYYWQAILTESSLVRRKTRSGADDGEYISLLNHNLVDYHISDDISNQVLDVSSANEDCTFKQLWTNNLLKYLSQHLLAKCQTKRFNHSDIVEIIWIKIQQLKLPQNKSQLGYRISKTSPDFIRQFQAINLIQLLIQFELDRIIKENQTENNYNHRGLIEFKYRTNFSDLNLANIDLNSIYFKDCDFSGSILSNANLTNAKFENCRFIDTNFKQAIAESTTFIGCIFNFQEHKKISSILKFQIKGISVKNCRFAVSQNLITVNTFLEYGAIDLGSRYASKFGRDFLKNQKKYLGEGLRNAENHYMYDTILPIVEEFSTMKNEIVLIDLMAGGNNERVLQLFKSYPKLSILAIDRHTEQLRTVQTEIGYRFKVVKKEISGKIGLGKMVESLFNSTLQKFSASYGLSSLRNRADIIIGKKAIHEISKQAQIELIKDCYNSLNSKGKLVLFTDSPISISENSFRRLSKLKSVVQTDNNIETIRHELIDNLKFNDSYDDAAIFSNLWVLLKDWANENKIEVQKRYFSSLSEIIGWGLEAGFEIVKEPFREHYNLTAKFFNEYAFNQIELLFERNQGKRLQQSQKQLIYEYLKGTNKHKVFFDFAEKHLFKNLHSNKLTTLGKFVGAQKVELPDKFREVNSKLENIKLPYKNGASFHFSVHVIVFMKP